MTSRTFDVALGVDPKFLENTLTKDIVPLEAIFDLVDNAIDAARERVLSLKSTPKDQFGLPESYSGYRIRLKICSDYVAISDNCTGISRQALSKYAFVTGSVSDHAYGIGGFGIGLKRALFRLGEKYDLRTDTGSAAAELAFDKPQLLSPNAKLIATVVRSRRRMGTLIKIRGLEPGVSHEFGVTSVQGLAQQLARRYGLFVRKGLKLVVNGTVVPAFGPQIRRKGPVKRKAAKISEKHGVSAFIESGMHEAYRLKGEGDYTSTSNARLTDEFGWYFVCNDRIVKVASREQALGWTTRWHQEYYGFVGWVRFVAASPERLPWDTKKTSIDPNSSVFREVAPKLQAFAEAYKAEIKGARAGTPSGERAASGAKRSARAEASKRRSGRAGHNENWETLLPPMVIGVKDAKIAALVDEAQNLPVTHPYAASLVFRSMLERTITVHLRQSKKYAAVCESHFESQRKAGRLMSDVDKRNFRPSLFQMIEWLGKNDDYFPAEVRRDCVVSRNKLKGHLKELNGIAHEGALTNSSKIKTARDDAMALVEFLLGVE